MNYKCLSEDNKLSSNKGVDSSSFTFFIFKMKYIFKTNPVLNHELSD